MVCLPLSPLALPTAATATTSLSLFSLLGEDASMGLLLTIQDPISGRTFCPNAHSIDMTFTWWSLVLGEKAWWVLGQLCKAHKSVARHGRDGSESVRKYLLTCKSALCQKWAFAHLLSHHGPVTRTHAKRVSSQTHFTCPVRAWPVPGPHAPRSGETEDCRHL